jgi:uridine kinase
MIVIGIAGGSGSGKTTFAKKVFNHIPETHCTLLSMDSYYLPAIPQEIFSKTGKPNFDHPHAFDWELLRNHLRRLKTGEHIEAPVYDFTCSQRSIKTQKLEPTKVVIFEGIFSLYDAHIRELLDIKCFLRVDADIRFTRRLHRDVKERDRSLDSVIAQYYDTVRPMYTKFLDPQKDFADFTVGEETDIAACILSARIKELIGQA